MRQLKSGKHERNPSEIPPAFQYIQPKNLAQQLYMESIQRADVVFGIGSAGTGKTFVAASYAAQELFYRNVGRVVVTRPNVEATRSFGYLPGTLEEKYAPFLEPFDSAFIRAFGRSFYDNLKKNGKIEPKPLGFLRGETFDNCIVLVDECQNMTAKEFKLVLTRIGENCKMIFSGDTKQVDIPNSGLDETINRLKYIPSIEVVEFMPQDIVRSKLCKEIILEYER